MERLLPGGVPRWIRAYDNGGETADRYTVIFTKADKYQGRETAREDRRGFMLYMSASPFHPQGVGMTSEFETWRVPDAPEGFAPAIGRKGVFGRRIRFEDLPEDCRAIVMRDYCDLWTLPDPWLMSLFEWENCDECGKGAENHTVISVLGNPFAKCNSVEE